MTSMRRCVLILLVFFISCFFFPPKVSAITQLTAGFESGDFSEFDATGYSNAENKLSVTHEAGLAGTGHGVSSLVNDLTHRYYKKSFTSTTGIYRARFYIDPNSISMSNNNSRITVLEIHGAGYGQTIGDIQMRYSAGYYWIRVTMVDDVPSYHYSDMVQITDEPQYIEVKWQKATGEDTSDAYSDLYINGDYKTSITGIDTYSHWTSSCGIEFGSFLKTGTLNGTIYLDQLTVNDDGSEIGPYDITPPSGGSIIYSDGIYEADFVSLTVDDGTDSQSRINTASRIVQRKSATLTGGSCGIYGDFSEITPIGSYPSFSDNTVTAGNCYQYRYLVSDNKGNQATYTSSNVAIFETPTPSPSPTPSPTATPTPNLSVASAPTCSDVSPGNKAPFLSNASAHGLYSVLLEFSEAEDPVSEYVLEYGTDPGIYQYATANIGGKGTKSYIVDKLAPDKAYYFRVRAGNGCATGPWSNEISAKINSVDFIQQNEGSESSINPVAENNKVRVFDVSVVVLNSEEKPVEGAKITLHSQPKVAFTDNNGIAKFSSVEPGEHKVLISYNNYEGEQNLNLTGDESTKEFNIKVVVNPKKNFLSTEVLITAGVSALIISALTFLLIKEKRKHKIH